MVFRRRLLKWLPSLASVTARSLLWISAAVAVLWLAASTLTLWQIRQYTAHAADGAAANLATVLAQDLEHSVVPVETMFQQIAEDLQLAAGQPPALAVPQYILFAGAPLLPNLAFLEVLDADGNVVSALRPEDRQKNWASTDYFNVVRRDLSSVIHVGLPFSQRRPEFAGIIVSRRLSMPDGTFAGAIVCGLRLAFVREMFDRLALGSEGAIALLRTDGVVLMRRPGDANTIGHMVDASDRLVAAIRADGNPVTLVDPLDHITRRITARRIGSLPLAVTVGMAPADIQAGWWPTTVGMTAGGLVLALCTMAIALQLRSELRRREQGEQAIAKKAGFLRSVSHELRAPLHGILGYAEQLRHVRLPDPYQHRLESIATQARELKDVVDRLLDFWRFEARGPGLNLQSIDMPKLLADCCSVVEPNAHHKSLDLQCRIAPDAPRRFVTDDFLVRRIVSNLLDNAVKFTQRGGVEVRYEGTSDCVRIEVADTGVGLTEEQRFELFGEDDGVGAGPTGTPGGGVGLSIVSRSARQLRGHTGHRPNAGGGSIFWVSLPAAAACEPTVARAPAASVKAPLHILLVDDSKTHLDLAGSHLRNAGHAVTSAMTGPDAVHIAGQHLFDVILMDMRLSDMDGLTAAQQIQALPGRAGRVPIVAVTADALDEDVDRYRRAGLAGYVSKPFVEAELLRAVAEVAEHSPPDAPREAPPAAPSELPLLDDTALAEGAASVGGQRMAEHITSLADSVAALLDAMRDAAGARGGDADIARLTKLAHIIAGDAGQLGFLALSQAARQFMVALGQSDADLDAVAARLRSVAARSEPVLRQRSESLRCAFSHSINPKSRRTETESTLR